MHTNRFIYIYTYIYIYTGMYFYIYIWIKLYIYLFASCFQYITRISDSIGKRYGHAGNYAGRCPILWQQLMLRHNEDRFRVSCSSVRRPLAALSSTPSSPASLQPQSRPYHQGVQGLLRYDSLLPSAHCFNVHPVP